MAVSLYFYSDDLMENLILIKDMGSWDQQYLIRSANSPTQQF